MISALADDVGLRCLSSVPRRSGSQVATSLANAVGQVDPAVVTDAMYYSWRRQPRGLTEIVEAEFSLAAWGPFVLVGSLVC